jgi:hypothetical protein
MRNQVEPLHGTQLAAEAVLANVSCSLHGAPHSRAFASLGRRLELCVWQPGGPGNHTSALPKGWRSREARWVTLWRKRTKGGHWRRVASWQANDPVVLGDSREMQPGGLRTVPSHQSSTCATPRLRVRVTTLQRSLS